MGVGTEGPGTLALPVIEPGGSVPPIMAPLAECHRSQNREKQLEWAHIDLATTQVNFIHYIYCVYCAQLHDNGDDCDLSILYCCENH